GHLCGSPGVGGNGSSPPRPPSRPVAKPGNDRQTPSATTGGWPGTCTAAATACREAGPEGTPGIRHRRRAYGRQSDVDAGRASGRARFRVNAARDRKGPVAVFRVIPAKVVTVEEMGLSDEVQKLCYLKKGLVLVTGPTGSGKSTTLCALIDLVNRTRSDHIITIEDPIEFVHENKKCLITQRQVHVHTDSFKSALRAALREDPDIVLVGELRDLETIAIA